jgi:hypothetical protein
MKGNKLLSRISYQGKAAVCGLTVTELNTLQKHWLR